MENLENREKSVISKCESKRPEGKSFHIRHTIDDFFEGQLHLVGYKDSKSEKNELVVFDDKKLIHVYPNFYELNQFLYGRYKDNTSSFRKLKEAYIPLTIALSLLGIVGIQMLCVGEEVPDALWAILSVVVGFYFGNAYNKKS